MNSRIISLYILFQLKIMLPIRQGDVLLRLVVQTIFLGKINE